MTGYLFDALKGPVGASRCNWLVLLTFILRRKGVQKRAKGRKGRSAGRLAKRLTALSECDAG
jgi:hypothetical protein